TPGRADFLLSKGSRAAVNAQDDSRLVFSQLLSRGGEPKRGSLGARHNQGSLPRTSQTSKTGCLRQPLLTPLQQNLAE
ncbi:MAG: hypothetical protein WA491_10195, partial [Candidatus Acidiferrum sp.]